MEEKLAKTVSRAAESWAFFAFNFSALSMLAFALLEDYLSKVRKAWQRTGIKCAVFVGLFYIAVVNTWSRNLQVRLYKFLATEMHDEQEALMASLLCVIAEVVGAVMVAVSILPSAEAEFTARTFSWGRNAVPVRFNRGLFRLGLALMVGGGIAGALLAKGGY